MRSASTRPFLSAPLGSVTAGDWTPAADGPALVADRVEGWDPNRNIIVRRLVTVDCPKVFGGCHLGSNARLRLIVSWHSAGTGLKAKALQQQPEPEFHSKSAPGQHEIIVEIPGSELSLEVTVFSKLVLAQKYTTGDLLAASLSGSVLWEDKKTLIIEGIASRFPVEAIPFTSDSSAAAWFLQIDGELDQPFLGAVRLFLNSLNPAVMKAAQAVAPDPADRMVMSSMYCDVGRQLTRFALESSEFRDAFAGARVGSCPFQENSLGRALWAMITPLSERASIGDLHQEMIASPASFERGLQHQFRLFFEAEEKS